MGHGFRYVYFVVAPHHDITTCFVSRYTVDEHIDTIEEHKEDVVSLHRSRSYKSKIVSNNDGVLVISHPDGATTYESFDENKINAIAASLSIVGA